MIKRNDNSFTLQRYSIDRSQLSRLKLHQISNSIPTIDNKYVDELRYISDSYRYIDDNNLYDLSIDKYYFCDYTTIIAKNIKDLKNDESKMEIIKSYHDMIRRFDLYVRNIRKGGNNIYG